MPASRPYWKGFLKLSFVSCPIALYPATSAAERVSFRQVNRRTGHRLKHKLVDSVTGKAVDASGKARAYEIAEDEFLLSAPGFFRQFGNSYRSSGRALPVQRLGKRDRTGRRALAARLGEIAVLAISKSRITSFHVSPSGRKRSP